MCMNTSYPLAVYIHWPFCRKKCPYCDFNSHVRANVPYARWQAALMRELEYQLTYIAPGFVVSSVFFGGGTPSLMPPGIVAALLEHLRPYMSPACEVTLEANPTSVEAANFAELAHAGVNRLSLGVQSLQAEALAFLGREHSAEEALNALHLAAQYFPRYSFDLIYARPEQTLADWQQELQQALTLARGHLSLYQLTIEEGTPFARWHAAKQFALPEESLAAELYECTQSILADAGYAAYEVSNYAQKGQESLHNLAYWRGQAYIGVGPGAHGRIPHASARMATVALSTPERWLAAVEAYGHGLEYCEAISVEDIAKERVMMGLRLSEGVPRVAVDVVINQAAVALLEAERIVWRTPSHIGVTPKGRLLLNSVIEALVTL